MFPANSLHCYKNAWFMSNGFLCMYAIDNQVEQV